MTQKMNTDNIHVVYDAENSQVLLVEADSADGAERKVASQEVVSDPSRVYWEGLLEDAASDIERDGMAVLNA